MSDQLHPVCPHCQVALRPRYFVGYYDSFYFWECDCVLLPDALVVAGAYSDAEDGVPAESVDH